MPSWPARTAVVPGAISISRESFEEIDTLIRSLRTGSQEFIYAMDTAAQLMTKAIQGRAQYYYRGPQADPRDVRRGQGAGRAFTIPVRRITGKTYQGWTVRRIALGIWELFNEERGAYMVEFGIVRGGGGVRRPILKMSAVSTLRFIQRTNFANRLMADTFGSLRNNRGQFRSFSARMAGSSLLGVVGPTGNLP